MTWFEQGHGSWSTATRLGVARDPVKRPVSTLAYQGQGALMDGRTAPRAYSFVKLLQRRVSDFRRDGSDGLRPKPVG
ncbi:hypothetical protein ACLQ21_11955 [Agrococcus sp. DT81.2]